MPTRLREGEIPAKRVRGSTGRGRRCFWNAPAKTPRKAGEFRFSEDGKTLTLPVTLEAGKAYTFSLNNIYRSGFVSEDGWPLDPVKVGFETGGE